MSLAPDVLKRFFTDKDLVEQDQHAEKTGIEQEFTAEFTGPERTNWWNAFVDGMNRLVRPIFTFGVAGLFVWCVIDPISFTVAMTALQAVPQMLWAIMIMILTFWFGGRLAETMQFAKVSNVPVSTIMNEIKAIRDAAATSAPGPAVSPAVQADETRRAAESGDIAPIGDAEYKEDLADLSKPMSLPAIIEWNRRSKEKPQ